MAKMTPRYVVAAALSKRHEELRGEAYPLDYDGASQVLRALDEGGYVIVHREDAVRPLPTREQIRETVYEKAQAVQLEGGYICTMLTPEDAEAALLALLDGTERAK